MSRSIIDLMTTSLQNGCLLSAYVKCRVPTRKPTAPLVRVHDTVLARRVVDLHPLDLLRKDGAARTDNGAKPAASTETGVPANSDNRRLDVQWRQTKRWFSRR